MSIEKGETLALNFELFSFNLLANQQRHLWYTVAVQAKSTHTFDTLYKALNAEQKKAVDAVEGPVMVIAGPGTGKTHMLTLRIANILRVTDTTPDNILALTFTESAAQSMRARLIEIIGSAAYRVHIHTFHGFCNGIIERNPDAFPRIVGSVHATDIDQIRIMEDVIDATRLPTLKPYGKKYHYVVDILSAIRELKREAITPADFGKQLSLERHTFEDIPDRYYESGRYAGRLKGKYATRAKELSKLSELLVLYRKYERELRDRGLYDYEDMIMETVAVLGENADLLLSLQERYQYILADEHQDANNGQNRLLALLASFHENPNLFVVGDEKQAIFRFQGASLENFLSFTRAYPGALVIRLAENYRSRQYVLDAAGSVIMNNAVPDERLRVVLTSARRDEKRRAVKRGEEAAVRVFALSEPSLEPWFVAHDIREAIDRGTPPEEIAILYRDNRDKTPFATALESLGIPFAVFSDESILEDPEIEKLVALLRAVDAPHRPELVGRAIFIDFLGIDPYDGFMLFDALMRMRKEQPRGKGNSPALNDLLRARNKLEAVGIRNAEIIGDRYRQILSWSAFAKNRGLMETLERIARESGFFTHILGRPDGHEIIRKFDRLIAEFSRTVPGHRAYTLHDALRHIDTLAFYHVALKASSDEMGESGGVRLMTAHRSKGREFDRVYIVGAMDGHWGNRHRARTFRRGALIPAASDGAIEAESDIADERRLFYVALTRARHGVNVTYAARDERGGRVLPSQFIEEIDAAHTLHVSTAALEPDLRDLKNDARISPPAPTAGLLATSDAGMVPEDRRIFLRDLFAMRGLSVSALNNYLVCPWRYFFENLIRLPHAPNRHQLYGIAMHASMKRLFDDLRFNRRPTKRRVLEAFQLSLKRQPLSERDFADTLAKGRAALSGYFDAHRNALHRPIDTEFAVRGILLEPNDIEEDPIRLTGILDKIEIDRDAERVSGRTPVVVTDYKTGKSHSRNYIEGKTKQSTGDYKRQLVFYKLLLNRFAEGKYMMTAGEIDFVEPDERGRYRRERFEVGEEEVTELEGVIRRVTTEIRTLAFWSRRCEDPKCEYCTLRGMMGKDGGVTHRP